ncbi:MAG: ribosome maturation factor RimP [Moorellales bacterium]
MTERVKDRLTAILEPVVEASGYELVDLEYQKESGRWVLRLFIDGPEGITLDDCEKVSERVGRYLDELDPIPHRYFLEVSSPGINRSLRKDKDFERFRGQPISVRTFAPVEGRRQFRGELGGLESGCVLVREGDTLWRIPREVVAKARLEAE